MDVSLESKSLPSIGNSRKSYLQVTSQRLARGKLVHLHDGDHLPYKCWPRRTKRTAKSLRSKRLISQRCEVGFQLAVFGFQRLTSGSAPKVADMTVIKNASWQILFASPPCIPHLLMAKDFKASVLHVSELSIALPWIPNNSPQSRFALDMDPFTYIGRITSLKEKFLTLMPFTNGVEAQQIQTDKLFMVLTLIGLRPNLECVRDQILASPSVPSLDDVFACLLRLSSAQPLSIDGPSDSSIYMDGLLALPTLLSHLILCYLDLTHCELHILKYHPLLSPSLGPWILDSGASNHISGNKHIFSSITTTSALPTVTLANSSKLWLKDRSTGKTIGIRREFQGLYHLTSPSSHVACISTDAPLLIHSRLGHPSLFKTSSPPRLRNASSWDTLDFRRTIVVIPLTLIVYFLSADVTFFEDSPFFSSSESLPISEVYHRRHRVVASPLSSVEVPDDSPPIPPISPTLALSSTDHLPYYSSERALVRALSHLGWRQAMVDEMAALHSNGTSDLVSLLPGYTQIYGCDYGDTFSPIAKIASVCLFLSMVAMCHWPFYQLDIKNAFLHGELLEEVYMEQPLSFAAQGEFGLVFKLRRSLYGLKQSSRAWFRRFSSVVQEFGMLRSEANHSVFYHHNSSS
ncbi:Retrovirus-related Pol polyprotein from transposon RE2 [Vitis vinifera]|uniref:Retrovirus-related Pol polyprotein from transposon RE2 n=1 Tax=Vitis vinifera TaxID=29760 RepID=A0A438I1N6_VITVI|nr:Retrovirus-related Pol polyprotein from transposon RE2 [Vitis vinifera]